MIKRKGCQKHIRNKNGKMLSSSRLEDRGAWSVTRTRWRLCKTRNSACHSDPVESPVAARLSNIETNLQRNLHGATSSIVPQVRNCFVRRDCDHTMKKCPYTVDAEELAATSETNRQNRPATRFSDLFRPSWQGSRQSNAKQSCHRTSFWGTNTARPSYLQWRLSLHQLVSCRLLTRN